jgi:ankyrin repeat protein
MTPLEVAASNGETQAIRCLLNAGADPNVTNSVRALFLLLSFSNFIICLLELNAYN